MAPAGSHAGGQHHSGHVPPSSHTVQIARPGKMNVAAGMVARMLVLSTLGVHR